MIQGPVLCFSQYGQDLRLFIKSRVWLLTAGSRREDLMLQRKSRFDQARNSSGGLRVTYVCFDGAYNRSVGAQASLATGV